MLQQWFLACRLLRVLKRTTAKQIQPAARIPQKVRQELRCTQHMLRSLLPSSSSYSPVRDLPDGWQPYPGIPDGYRVRLTIWQCLLSIFSTGHNEFWMIWTDVAPLLLCAAMMVVTASSTPAEEEDEGECSSGKRQVFQSIVACRLCSLLFHVFNCHSLLLNQRLVYLDLAGIACNAWGCGWVGCMAGISMAPVKAAGMYFCASCAVALFQAKPPPMERMQRMLVAMAAVGNAPCLALLGRRAGPLWLRGCLSVEMLCFAGGYYLFYCRQLVGRHSHACWHVATFLGQLSFLATTQLHCRDLPLR